MSIPLVSVIIPTHNRKLMVKRLIQSILKSTYKNIEIIVIDDASSDDTYEYISDFFKEDKTIKVFRNKTNLFTAGSRNEGFKHAKGQYIFFIDDDNELEKHAISLFVNAFASDESIGELGPVNYSFENKKKILWARTKRNMLTSVTYQSRSLEEFGNQKFWESDDVPNAFMVRKDIVKKNNILFRRQYGIMYEESDYAYRIRELGYKVMVVRDARIYHDVENTQKDGSVKDYLYHFMEDERRPFVFARNRILFHSLYSTKSQFLLIICIWIWVFAAYYIHTFLSYSDAGNFSLSRRVSLAIAYIRGTFSGLYFVFSGKKLV